MNIKLLVFVLTVGILLSSIAIVEAVPTEKQAKHEKEDNTPRIKQTFDIASISGEILSTDVILHLDTWLNSECVIILNEPHLKKIPVSDNFTCQTENVIPLTVKGKHALQSKINTDRFELAIKSVKTGEIIYIPSNDITLSITYQIPSYYALIENGIVTNVIVAEKSFVDKLNGNWKESGKLAGIGYSYDVINDKFISPQPFPSWILESDNWVSPVPYPTDGKYFWDENLTGWVLVETT